MYNDMGQVETNIYKSVLFESVWVLDETRETEGTNHFMCGFDCGLSN